MKAPALMLSALLVAGPAFAQDAKDAPAPKPAAESESKAEITVRGAQGDEATKAKLRANALLGRCQIKPVMTDEEIRLCVTAYKQSR